MNNAHQSSLNKNLTLVMILVVSLILSIMIAGKYNSLHYSVMDLGTSIHTFFGINDFDEYSRISFGHFQPYLVPYAKLWGFFERSVYFILLLQLFLLLLPVYWVYKKYGNIPVLAYLLYFPLWFNALFDFHIDHLVVPILFGFFIAVDNKRYAWASILAVSLAFVKEPFALQTIMCGIYIVVRGYRSHSTHFSRIVIGLCVTAFGFIFFYLAVNYLALNNSGNYILGSESGAFSWLGSDVGGVLWSIVSQPIEIVSRVLSNADKIAYVLALFGALGFISLLSPTPLIVAFPILAISLLSEIEGYYGLGNHYTVGLIAPIIFSFIGGLPRAKIIWHKIGFFWKRLPESWFAPVLVSGLVCTHIVLSPSPISRLFWSDKIWSYNYKAYIYTERDAMIKQAISDFIPADLDAVISIQNTINLAPLVQRQHFLLFPQGIDKEKKSPLFSDSYQPTEVIWKAVTADYIVLDLKRPWFLLDKGCGWQYGKCTNKKVAKEYLEWVVKSRSLMNVVFERDDFLILSRNK